MKCKSAKILCVYLCASDVKSIKVCYLIRLLSCVNSLMNQSSAVATKGFWTIAADKSVSVSVSYYFVSFEGRLVLQELATLGAWNLYIILL